MENNDTFKSLLAENLNALKNLLNLAAINPLIL